MIGETEEGLKRNGVEYPVGRARYDDNARGKIIGDPEGMLKFLLRRSDLQVLGVHAIGEQATELVHIGLMAMLTGSAARIFEEACFNLPMLGHMYKTAALDAMNNASTNQALLALWGGWSLEKVIFIDAEPANLGFKRRGGNSEPALRSARTCNPTLRIG
jgi:pyridine nucleotide-disulfide oxidoreductase